MREQLLTLCPQADCKKQHCEGYYNSFHFIEIYFLSNDFQLGMRLNHGDFENHHDFERIHHYRETVT
ncbi:MAG: hypothetical protein ACJAYJ_004496 [Saprospiraceae bacterium]|jgi:hypothetical protein